MSRANARAAEAFGITRSWARVSAFAVSAALAGAMLAFASSTVSPNSFTLWSSIFLLVGSVVSLNGLNLRESQRGHDLLRCPGLQRGTGDDLASNPIAEAANGRPSRLGPSCHDPFAGCYAVIGILSALASRARHLHHRHVSGKGPPRHR